MEVRHWDSLCSVFFLQRALALCRGWACAGPGTGHRARSIPRGGPTSTGRLKPGRWRGELPPGSAALSLSLIIRPLSHTFPGSPSKFLGSEKCSQCQALITELCCVRGWEVGDGDLCGEDVPVPWVLWLSGVDASPGRIPPEVWEVSGAF